MSIATSISFPPAAALHEVRIPPLVHPSVLQAAAAHCAEFGGNREALNAAALAASLLQGHLIEARKAAGKPLQDDAPKPMAAPIFKGLSADIENSPHLSEQAKQAMAAAQATNAFSNKKEKEKEKARAAATPEGRGQEATFPGSQSLLQPRLSLAPGLPFSPPIDFSDMGGPLGNMAMPAMPAMPPPMPHAMPPPSSLTMPPPADFSFMQTQPLLMPELPPMPEIRVPQPQPKQPQPKAKFGYMHPEHVPYREAPPHRPQQNDATQGKAPPVPQRERKEREPPKQEWREEQQEEKIPEDQARCHLHRKPQMNCKTCRRLHFSALDPSASQKEDAGKERSAIDKLRRASDDSFSIHKRSHDVFEVQNKQTFNLNAMLRDQILKNTYFKSIMNIDTFEAIVDEMYQYADTAETYGAGTTTVPSTLMCCLFRMFTIGLSYDELTQLLENEQWPYVRCCGFLYIRYGCSPERLWEHLGEYCLDDQEFTPSKTSPDFKVSMGEYVEALLMDERYYFTALPRIPVATKKKIEEKIAPVSQYRRRTQANKENLHLFYKAGTPVEFVNANGDWMSGEVIKVDERIKSRISIRVRCESGHEESAHIGKVVLKETPGRGARPRSRSRSPRRGNSPDWTRSRGMTTKEMLEDLRAKQRERAVCSTGKDYARKPIGFMSGLALKRDMGIAASRLREDETYAPRQVDHRKQLTPEEEEEQRRQERAKFDADRQQSIQMQNIYKKYGAAASAAVQQESDTQPYPADVLRLG